MLSLDAGERRHPFPKIPDGERPVDGPKLRVFGNQPVDGNVREQRFLRTLPRYINEMQPTL